MWGHVMLRIQLSTIILRPAILALLAISAAAQVDTSRVLGQVFGPSGETIAKARVEISNLDQGTRQTTFTAESGLYVFPSLRPGHYSIAVSAPGFRTDILGSLTLYTQHDQQQNFQLVPGSPLEAVNIEPAGTPIATTGTVGTVVDGTLVRDLPLNGRSFQTLFQLTPGVVLTQTDFANRGQFSTNGQRSNSNAVYIDGISANFDISPGVPLGQSASGSLPVVTAWGGTNALVSVDDVHEFVVLTSNYSPEFGRFSGGQISIVTRSGTKSIHGDTFEYFRNEALDANDWFANKNHLPRAAIRQSDFGATLGGPVPHVNAFWFTSYEGLRLDEPASKASLVPSISARELALPAIQPFLKAYPLPTRADEGNGLAPAVYSFSNPSGLTSFSTRLDMEPSQSLRIFGRYFQSESDHRERGQGNASLSSVTLTRFASKGIVLGVIAGSSIISDLRLSYANSSTLARDEMNQFEGAVSVIAPVPAPFSAADSLFQFSPDFLIPLLSVGIKANNSSRQLNLVENISLRMKKHSLKLGIDLRKLSPNSTEPSYLQQDFFSGMSSALIGQHAFSVLGSSVKVESQFNNYSAYVEDSWRMSNSLNITAGIRWDFTPAPVGKGANGSLPVALSGLDQLKKPEIAQTQNFYRTPIANIAPRLGFTYAPGRTRGPLVQGGLGIFYDLGNAPAGNAVSSSFFPFLAEKFVSDTSFPLQAVDPPALNPPSIPFSTIQAFPLEIYLPYSEQWSIGIQQSVGSTQSVSATYVGSHGRQLLRTEEYIGGTALVPSEFGQVLFTNNAGFSNYDSLQIRYQSLGHAGLHLIAGYVLSHSRDNVSTDAVFNGIPSRLLSPKLDYSDSDFDVRHTANLGLHYDLKNSMSGPFRCVLSGLSLDSIFWYRSAPPVDVTVARDIGFGVYDFRPDLVPNAPLYLRYPTGPGSRRLNPGAFSIPTDLRQGAAPRNLARGFSLVQVDAAIAKDLANWKRLKLRVRIETFNVFNHPSFSPPPGFLGTLLPNGTLIRNDVFGISQQNFAQGLQTGVRGPRTGFSPLYQVGSPRSLQAVMRIEF